MAPRRTVCARRLLFLLLAAALCRDTYGLSSPTTTSTKPIWFLPPSNSDVNCQHTSSSLSCVVFLHGRLEAEDCKAPFPPPSQLYRQFCSSLVETMEEPVLMIDYHDILSKQLGREPRTWNRGPIAQSIVDVLESEMLNLSDSSDSDQVIDVTLITFSMGAAMGLKVLHRHSNSDSENSPFRISKVAFIEPIWRCWLSLVPRTAICEIPVLAIYGTNDSETLTDCGMGGVQSVLQPLLPNLTVHELCEANHWYIIDDNVVYDDDKASKDKNTRCQYVGCLGLSPDSQTTPAEFRSEAITALNEFCYAAENNFT